MFSIGRIAVPHSDRQRFGLAAAAALLGAVFASGTVGAQSSSNSNNDNDDQRRSGRTTVVHYSADNETEYQQKWTNQAFGVGELAVGGTRTTTKSGTTVTAVPFRTGVDFSVFDHVKYIAISTQSFAVPENGSLEFEAEMTARTPGTQPGRMVVGCYGPYGSYTDTSAACGQPFQHVVRQGQQAGVVLNMINFETGQLFDWFISGNTAFALIERLPSNISGSPGTPVEKAYTQIIKEVQVTPGKKHKVAIRYTRGPSASYVEYFLDGDLFTRVDNVGIPLDMQNKPYTGYAPSLGAGEPLKSRLNSFVIAHGLFSLLDAFPYHHPDRPDLSVSIPVSQRLFGQGAIGNWDKFKVTTKVHN
jgi:hypothetical protein